jgi:hypothetical protein
MESVFTNVYENKVWGNNKNKQYKGSSGSGSNVKYNEKTYIPFLKEFITNTGIKTVVDLGCGDFKCGNLIYESLNVEYTGYDTYKKVIESNSAQHLSSKYNFNHLDFCNNGNQIVSGDLCIIKDVIQHWSLDNIYTFLDFLVNSKKFKYILICNCCNQQKDDTNISNGDFRCLSSKHFPLKKYNPTIVYKYHTKEVSVITCDQK